MDAITLAEYRADKDKYFRGDHHSPVPLEKQANFVRLTYLDWNPDLVFTVAMVDADRSPTSIATTDRAERTHYTAGAVELLLSGENMSLTVYDTGHPGLFLPFRDAPSGNETYGAGRYLNLQPNHDGTVTTSTSHATRSVRTTMRTRVRSHQWRTGLPFRSALESGPSRRASASNPAGRQNQWAVSEWVIDHLHGLSIGR